MATHRRSHEFQSDLHRAWCPFVQLLATLLRLEGRCATGGIGDAGDQRAARERVRATGERYSRCVAGCIESPGALKPTDPGGRIPLPALCHSFRDTWLQMNARMAAPTVRDVERIVRYAMPFSQMTSPTLTKHGLLFQFARLELPLAAAQQQCNAPWSNAFAG